MVRKLACNSRHWVVPLCFTVALWQPIPRPPLSSATAHRPTLPSAALSASWRQPPANCILRILLRKRSSAGSVREARFQCFAGTYLCHIAGTTSTERKIFCSPSFNQVRLTCAKWSTLEGLCHPPDMPR